MSLAASLEPSLVHEPSYEVLSTIIRDCLSIPSVRCGDRLQGSELVSNRWAYLDNSDRRSFSARSPPTAGVLVFFLNLFECGIRSSILSDIFRLKVRISCTAPVHSTKDSLVRSSRIFKVSPESYAGSLLSFRAVKGLNQPAEGYEPTHTDLGQGYPRARRVCWTSLSKHEFVFGTAGGYIWETDKPARCDPRGSDARMQRAIRSTVMGGLEAVVNMDIQCLEPGSRSLGGT